MLSFLFFAFSDWLSCLVLLMMESSADTRMYLRYEATIEEGTRSNDVEDRTCHLLSVEDVIRLPEHTNRRGGFSAML